MRIVVPMMITATAAKSSPSAMPGGAGDVADVVELLHPVLAVAHVVDERIALNALRHVLHGRGIAMPLLEPHLDRRRQEARVEHILELGELRARARERLLGRHLIDARDLGKRRDVAHRRADRLGERAVGEEGDDLDVLLDAAQRAIDVEHEQPEQPEGEEAEGDRDDAQGAEQRRASHAEHDFAKGEPHQVGRAGRDDARAVAFRGIEHELAAIHLDHAIRIPLHELEVVRRHEHRGSGGVDVAQQLEDAARRAIVEIAGGLVGHEEHGIVHERARDRHALLLAAGELLRIARPLAREPDLREQPAHARRNPLARRAGHLERERDVLLGGAILEQAKVLEDDADPAAQPRNLRARKPRGEAAAHAHFARSRRLLDDHEAQDRRFPRAARPREKRELTLVDAEGHVVESESGARIFLDDVRKSDHRLIAFGLGSRKMACGAATGRYTIGARRRAASSDASAAKRLIEIGDDVVGILDADADAQEAVRDAERRALLEREMRRATRSAARRPASRRRRGSARA